MAERITYPQWRNANEASKYPFADNATLKNANSKVISPSLLIDARIHLVGGSGGFYISKITVKQSLITIEISDTDGNKCSGTANLTSTFTEIPLYDSYNRTAGTLVTSNDRIASLIVFGVGEHTFNRDQTEFNSIVCVPVPAYGVIGIIDSKNNMISNDVWIVGKNGVVLSNDNGQIRIDLVGHPFLKRETCYSEDNSVITNSRAIKTINGAYPDVYGNFTITSGDGITTVSGLRVLADDSGNITIGLFNG